MTNALKAAAMYRVLSLAPMRDSKARFLQLAQEGKVDAFWKFYEGCMRTQPERDAQIEKAGKVSFRMLKPAIEAIYRAA
jgi:hypothetical protein